MIQAQHNTISEKESLIFTKLIQEILKIDSEYHLYYKDNMGKNLKKSRKQWCSLS